MELFHKNILSRKKGLMQVFPVINNMFLVNSGEKQCN